VAQTAEPPQSQVGVAVDFFRFALQGISESVMSSLAIPSTASAQHSARMVMNGW